MAKLFAIICLCWASLVQAGVDVHLQVDVGPQFFVPAEPAIVLAAPGIYVIPDYPYEVFFLSGFYWTFHSNHWYRCGGPKGKWVVIETGKVPPGLVKIPPGKYKHWKAQGNAGFKPGKGKGHGKHK